MGTQTAWRLVLYTAPNREKQQTERVSERVAQRKQRKATKQRGWHRGNREGNGGKHRGNGDEKEGNTESADVWKHRQNTQKCKTERERIERLHLCVYD